MAFVALYYSIKLKITAVGAFVTGFVRKTKHQTAEQTIIKRAPRREPSGGRRPSATTSLAECDRADKPRQQRWCASFMPATSNKTPKVEQGTVVVISPTVYCCTASRVRYTTEASSAHCTKQHRTRHSKRQPSKPNHKSNKRSQAKSNPTQPNPTKNMHIRKAKTKPCLKFEVINRVVRAACYLEWRRSPSPSVPLKATR